MVKKSEKEHDISAEKNAEETINETQAQEQNGSNKAEEKEEETPKMDEPTEKDDIDPKDQLIAELQAKKEELNEKYLRLFSEFDNFRKRSLKEKIDLTKTAAADIIEAILPVVDDLDRAYEASAENPDPEVMAEGLHLIQAKMKTTLKHKGLEEIACEGQSFDTDFHEAITNIPAPKPEDKGKIMDTVQKGYTLNGKVLRFAKVVVAN